MAKAPGHPYQLVTGKCLRAVLRRRSNKSQSRFDLLGRTDRPEHHPTNPNAFMTPVVIGDRHQGEIALDTIGENAVRILYPCP
jgi:hypothetical protein